MAARWHCCLPGSGPPILAATSRTRRAGRRGWCRRRWRKAPLSATTRAEVGTLWKRLRASEYDVVIDTQGNVKSALIARAVRGEPKAAEVVAQRNEAKHPFAAN